MTANSLTIYAFGGGHGHCVRAINMANRLLLKYSSIHILCYEKSFEFSNDLPSQMKVMFCSWEDYISRYQTSERDLIVDTFPDGHKGEIKSDDIKKFKKSTLLARFSKDPNHHSKSQKYNESLYPYEEGFNEWTNIENANCIGVLKKSNHCKLINKKNTFTMVDPDKRISDSFVEKFKEYCENRKMEFNYQINFENQIIGEKILMVGAGYNTFYELFDQNKNIKFLPINKKYDDQFKRVNMYNKGVENLQEVLNWIDERPT